MIMEPEGVITPLPSFSFKESFGPSLVEVCTILTLTLFSAPSPSVFVLIMAPSALYQSIQSVVDAYFRSYTEAIEKGNISIYSAALAPNCVRQIVPAGALGLPEQGLSNTEYEAVMAAEFAAIDTCSVEVKDVVIDENVLKASARAIYQPKLKGNDMAEQGEFFFSLTMQDNGDGELKIGHIIEFMDLKWTEMYVEKVGRIGKELGLA